MPGVGQQGQAEKSCLQRKGILYSLHSAVMYALALDSWQAVDHLVGIWEKEGLEACLWVGTKGRQCLQV